VREVAEGTPRVINEYGLVAVAIEPPPECDIIIWITGGPVLLPVWLIIVDVHMREPLIRFVGH
jgi:hypothetical protein